MIAGKLWAPSYDAEAAERRRKRTRYFGRFFHEKLFSNKTQIFHGPITVSNENAAETHNFNFT